VLPDATFARLAPLLADADHIWGGTYIQLTLAWAHLERGEAAMADELAGRAVTRARCG
jgi:hypothetical protein